MSQRTEDNAVTTVSCGSMTTPNKHVLGSGTEAVRAMPIGLVLRWIARIYVSTGGGDLVSWFCNIYCETEDIYSLRTGQIKIYHKYSFISRTPLCPPP